LADAERSLAAAGDGKARRQGATVAHRSDYIKLGFEKSLALRSPTLSTKPISRYAGVST
jgi:hypothetical protein